MNTSDAGISLIKGFEKFEPQEYKDFAGYPSIGYGHKIVPGDNFPPFLTEQDATALLCRDLVTYEACVNNSVEVDLTQDQFDALVSLCYNIGCHAFDNSTLLKDLNAGNTQAAANQFKSWCHAGGLVSDILLARREKEQTLFLT